MEIISMAIACCFHLKLDVYFSGAAAGAFQASGVDVVVYVDNDLMYRHWEKMGIPKIVSDMSFDRISIVPAGTIILRLREANLLYRHR